MNPVLPTDDDDCAAWIADDNGIRFISSEELEAMPESVTDLINLGFMTRTNGMLVGPSFERLKKAI